MAQLVKQLEKEERQSIIDLSEQEALDIIEKINNGISFEEISMEYNVKLSEITTFIGKPPKKLTGDERKVRKQSLLMAFANNKEEIQKGKSKYFQKLSRRYGISTRQLYRIYDEPETKEFLKKYKGMTQEKLGFIKFRNLPIIKLFEKEKLENSKGKNPREMLSKNLSALYKIFSEWFNYSHPNQWEMLEIKDKLEEIERGVPEKNKRAKVTHQYRTALNQLKKLVGNKYGFEDQRFRLKYNEMGANITHCTHAGLKGVPSGIIIKNPLTLEQFKLHLTFIPKLYGITDEIIDKHITLFRGTELNEEEMEDQLLEQAIRELAKISKDYENKKRAFKDYEKDKSKANVEALRGKLAYNYFKTVMKDIRDKFSSLKKELEQVKKALSLILIIRLSFTTGLRRGKRSHSRTDKFGITIHKEDHGASSLKFGNFHNDFNLFSLKEKGKFWMNVRVTKETKKALNNYLAVLPMERKTGENYVFQEVEETYRKRLEELTELSGIGVYKRTEKGRKVLKNTHPVMLKGIHIHPHLYRATLASYLYNVKGYDVKTIMKIGHWIDEATVRRYIVEDGSRIAKCYNDMEKDGI